MGADFSSHRVFAGNIDANRLRVDVIAAIRRHFDQIGLIEINDELQASRSVVIGPAGRWIFVGDSAGSTDVADWDAFHGLSSDLSRLAPVTDIVMSDDAAVHFFLYRDCQLVDEFGNAEFPFLAFASEQEAEQVRGNPELWRDLLVERAQTSDLRKAWTQVWQAQAREILVTTAHLLGWEQGNDWPSLLWTGYYWDDEGDACKYDEFVRNTSVNLAEFEELHFARNATDAIREP